MSFEYTVAGAQSAMEAGSVAEWVQAYLKEPASKNRNLAAILHGQQPIWTGPLQIELNRLVRVAGPGPGYRYSYDPEIWSRDVQAIATTVTDPTELPPMIARAADDGIHLSDGNHRLDALTLLGHDSAWVLLWSDRDARCANSWSPFAPESSPILHVAEGESESRARLFCSAHVRAEISSDDTFLLAEIDERPIGVLVVGKEESMGRIKALYVLSQYRNRRLATRLLVSLKEFRQSVRCSRDFGIEQLLGEAGCVRTGTDGELIEFSVG